MLIDCVSVSACCTRFATIAAEFGSNGAPAGTGWFQIDCGPKKRAVVVG